MTYIISALLVATLQLFVMLAITDLLPPSRTETTWPIDNFKADGWPRETRQIVYGVARLRGSEQPGLFILGSSVAREAYRPPVLKALLPEYEAHNLGYGGTNIHGMAEALEHIGTALPAATRRQSIVVITLQVHLMVSDDLRWRRSHWVPEGYRDTPVVVTDVGREGLRCGVICTAGSAAFTHLPASIINGVKSYFLQFSRFQERLPDSLGNWAKGQAKRLRFVGTPQAAAAVSPQPPPTVDERMTSEIERFERIWFFGNVSTLEDEQFTMLRQMVARARALGFKVVLVDTPLGSWLSQQWPTLMQVYQQKVALAVAELTRDPQVAYIDFRSSAPDAEFSDPTHPLPKFRDAWSARLAEAMRPVLRRWQ